MNTGSPYVLHGLLYRCTFISHPGLNLGHIITDTAINKTSEHRQRLCLDSRQIRLVSQIQYERKSALLCGITYRIGILCPDITKLSEMVSVVLT